MVIESDGPIMIGKLQLVFKMCKKKKMHYWHTYANDVHIYVMLTL